MLGSLATGEPVPNEDVVFGRERHTHARYDDLGYPARAIRSHDYLYIHNFKPDRWPAGDPEGYCDIDPGLAKAFLRANKEKYPGLFERTFGKDPKRNFTMSGNPWTAWRTWREILNTVRRRSG